MQYCKFCGEVLPPGAHFCASCGRLVSSGQEAPNDSAALTTISNSIPTVFAASSDLTQPVEGSDGGSQDATLTDDEEEERRRRLLGLPMLGALAGEVQAPPSNVGMVQGTPQVSGVPSVEGTPTPEHMHPSPEHLHQHVPHGFRPQTPPHPVAQVEQHAEAGFHSQATVPKARAAQAHRQRGLHHVGGRVLTVSVSSVVVVASVITALVFLVPTSISLRGGGTVSPGGTLHLHGSGFAPGSRVTLTLDNRQPLFFVHTSGGTSSGGETLAGSPEDATIMQALMTQFMRSGAHKSGRDSSARVSISMSNVIQVGLSGSFDVAIPVSSSWSPGSHTIHATENITGLGVQRVQLTFTLEPSAARLVVAPVSLDFGMLKKGSKATKTVTISNTGQQPLDWSADVGATRWLALDTSSGTIPPGGSQTINVTADTASLASGSHSASLAINAGSQSMQVAVTLGVNVLPTPTPRPQPTVAPSVPTPAPTQPPPPTSAPAAPTRVPAQPPPPPAQPPPPPTQPPPPPTQPPPPAQRPTQPPPPTSAPAAPTRVPTQPPPPPTQPPPPPTQPPSPPTAPPAAPTRVPTQPPPPPTQPPSAQLCHASATDFGQIPQGQRASAPVTFGNCGNAPLNWSAQTDGSSWLSLDNTSGVVAPGGSGTITMTVDTSSMSPGTHVAHVTITSNGGTLTVTVTITITG
jgi:hypothetical protein